MPPSGGEAAVDSVGDWLLVPAVGCAVVAVVGVGATVGIEVWNGGVKEAVSRSMVGDAVPVSVVSSGCVGVAVGQELILPIRDSK